MKRNEENQDGSTVVIHHQVRREEQTYYEKWLAEIASVCRSSAGHLDWQIIRPIVGLSEGYTVVIRFDTQAHLRDWMSSSERRHLIEKARPFLALEDAYSIHSGLDFLFYPADSKTKVPVRWKQYLITWSAIFPLAVLVPLAVNPVLRAVGLNRPVFATLCVTAIIVFLMVYLVMPHYTRLVRKWLFS